MTQGETLFYLREIRSHWSTSNVSSEKLAELEAAGLIESILSPVLAFRLTNEGARCKALGRPPSGDTRISLTDKKRTFRRRIPKRNVAAPKPLV